MPDRPYILLSCGMSIDGYLGSAAPRRLELSNSADFDRVDAVRASCDAILVGAATVRTDNPRLPARSQNRREGASARGLPNSPMKVTVTERVQLDPLPTSSPPATTRSSSTAPARASATPGRGWAASPRSSTAAAVSACAGSARISAPGACSG